VYTAAIEILSAHVYSITNHAVPNGSRPAYLFLADFITCRISFGLCM